MSTPVKSATILELHVCCLVLQEVVRRGVPVDVLHQGRHRGADGGDSGQKVDHVPRLVLVVNLRRRHMDVSAQTATPHNIELVINGNIKASGVNKVIT